MKKTDDGMRVVVRGEAKIWQQMNVYLHLYLFDEQGVQTTLLTIDNRTERQNPHLELHVPASVAEILACLYVVPQEFPASTTVADSPPLALTLEAFHADHTVPFFVQQRKINQWGGDQIIGLKITTQTPTLTQD